MDAKKLPDYSEGKGCLNVSAWKILRYSEWEKISYPRFLVEKISRLKRVEKSLDFRGWKKCLLLVAEKISDS